MQRWQSLARRIRVPLGFITAALYVFEVARHPAHPAAVAWSLVLVLPGLALRAVASGTVKKNRELAVSGPYAYTRNPLYLGSMLIAFGFAAAAASWVILALLALLFAAIYIPTIQSEEAYLREHFAGYVAYARAVPRLLPRGAGADKELAADGAVAATGGFSAELYRRHREYNSAMGAAAIYLALALKLLFFSR